MLAAPYMPLATLLDAQGQLLAEYRHYPTDELIYVGWHGHLRPEEVAAGALEHLRLQTSLRCPRALNDKSDGSGDWREVMPLLQYEWLPLAQATGLRALAYVFSSDLAARMVSEEFVAAIRPHLAVELFQNVNTAWRWLLTQ